ncbi:aldehyde dehydrogenase family protein [Bosea sp. (in: a-proteobacteria)]|uniref:aldehyde dehydrogenase family protein n=1 Tax=Bosea sp. (in: a-proteobacteria) TaxID=1871050 RepID=UPI001ACF1810|nr:aldehyde dehydrogenase family protein [Bosea sp. (in: a-proteobacteria)]MBN9438291.1 aldehyde dehydrogenase family protein [Bosea sp. (in: a-proteobacteria)]
MTHNLEFYIDGAWVLPAAPGTLEVVDPSTEEPFTTIAVGGVADVEKAVRAAKTAFSSFSLTSKQERVDLLKAIAAAYKLRRDDIAHALSREMGAPLKLAIEAQSFMGIAHIEKMISVLESYDFNEIRGTTVVTREPIGVCALITPWNWPLNQIACKVAPALAAGCTMVLKPSEISPISALIFAEVLHEAGVPKGVFNLVNGTGPVVGDALSRHPDVDMVSFTGSTRAGVEVAKAAADTVKRVHQELGGKSANIILDDADLGEAVRKGIAACFRNSGQSCNAPSRMLVPAARHEEAVAVAREAAAGFRPGAPAAAGSDLGPVANRTQFEKIQKLIEAGLNEGATLVAGGAGRPEGLNRGFYVRPTIFAGVHPEMTIAREEIFGPVLSILPYADEDEAVAIANDSVYGLAAYVQAGSKERGRDVARRMRAGTVYLNYPAWDSGAPFGGYKRSGNGREYADFGLAEFLEIKGMVGYH